MLFCRRLEDRISLNGNPVYVTRCVLPTRESYMYSYLYPLGDTRCNVGFRWCTQLGASRR